MYSAKESSFQYQVSASGHRGTRAIQRLVEYAPASGGLALWMQHRDVEQTPARMLFTDTDSRKSNKKWVIGNDGSTLFYGPGFTAYALEEQTGLVAHQVLHVALRHVQREQELRTRLGNIDSELFTVCADAIVNASLSHLTWLALPKGSVLLDTLLHHVLGIDQAVDVSLHEWDVETLYRAIDDRQQQSGGARSDSASNGQGDSQEKNVQQTGNDQNTTGQNQEAANANAMRDGPRSHAARKLAASVIRDLIPDADDSPEDKTQQAAQWSTRLLQAHAADGDQSFMRQLLADNRKLNTPWEQLLRTRLQRALTLQPETNWSRPTRSWIANQGRTQSGKRLPWQPGTSYSRTAPRLCIMVDVSGSVDTDLMQRFSNEIARIIRTFKTQALLIIGDDTVREQHLLKSDVKQLRTIQFDGGGGTNFVPLILAATEFKPDIGVFLTDLEGPAGEAPIWPLIWAVPAKADAQNVPYGQRIILD